MTLSINTGLSRNCVCVSRKNSECKRHLVCMIFFCFKNMIERRDIYNFFIRYATSTSLFSYSLNFGFVNSWMVLSNALSRQCRRSAPLRCPCQSPACWTAMPVVLLLIMYLVVLMLPLWFFMPLKIENQLILFGGSKDIAIVTCICSSSVIPVIWWLVFRFLQRIFFWYLEHDILINQKINKLENNNKWEEELDKPN